MKVSLELPDDLFRRAKAMAALRGESLTDFFTTAIQTQLERQASQASTRQGWRSVFGQARREDVEAIDAVIAEELERVDPVEWR